MLKLEVPVAIQISVLMYGCSVKHSFLAQSLRLAQ